MSWLLRRTWLPDGIFCTVLAVPMCYGSCGSSCSAGTFSLWKLYPPGNSVAPRNSVVMDGKWKPSLKMNHWLLLVQETVQFFRGLEVLTFPNGQLPRLPPASVVEEEHRTPLVIIFGRQHVWRPNVCFQWLVSCLIPWLGRLLGNVKQLIKQRDKNRSEQRGKLSHYIVMTKTFADPTGSWCGSLELCWVEMKGQTFIAPASLNHWILQLLRRIVGEVASFSWGQSLMVSEYDQQAVKRIWLLCKSLMNCRDRFWWSDWLNRGFLLLCLLETALCQKR